MLIINNNTPTKIYVNNNDCKKVVLVNNGISKVVWEQATDEAMYGSAIFGTSKFGKVG